MASRTGKLAAATFLFTVLTSTIAAQAARPVSDAEAGDMSLGDVGATNSLSGRDPFCRPWHHVPQKWERRAGSTVSNM
jgi:hypothetical protein